MIKPDQLEKAEQLLNQNELDALKRLPNTPGTRLSPHAAANFFALFLQGYDCATIAAQNPNFGRDALGLIVRARIEYDWDAARDRYIRDMMESVSHSVAKVTLESIQMTSDAMAVFHRLVGDKFRRYLQTGDPSVLGEFGDMSLKSYKDFVELNKRMRESASDNSTQKVHITESEIVASPPATSTPQLPEKGNISPEQAFSLLNYLASKKT